MSTDTYGETDLRHALASLSLDDGQEPDVTDLRARVLASVDGTDAPHADGEVLELQPARTGQRRRRPLRRTGWLAAAAAAVVALLAAAAVVFVGQGKDVSPADAFRDMVADPYPGTVVVALYEGTGSKTVSVPDREVGAYTQWTVYSECTGKGVFWVNDTGSGDCGGAGTGGVSVKPSDWRGKVEVRAGADVSWRVVVALTPDTRTNGGVGSPVDGVLRFGAKPGLAYTGTGSAVVQVKQPSGSDHILQLTCRGTGVQIVGARADFVKAGSPLSTRTCFPKQFYEWQNVVLTQGQDLRIVAAPGTRWRFTVG